MQRTPPTPPLLHRFAAHSIAQPHAVACQCHQARFTYWELHNASDQLAAELLSRGLQRGDRVAICMPKSSLNVVAILAVIKASGIFLPIDPEYPEDRLQFITQDSKPRLVLTSLNFKLPDAFTKIPSLAIDQAAMSATHVRDITLAVETPQESLPASSTALNSKSMAVNDPAVYMIYTSGSTGRPKAVVVGQRSTQNFVDSMLASPGFQSTDVLLSMSTLAFDISIFDIFVPLSAGGRIVITSREVARDGRLLARAIESSDANIMLATPSSWRMLIDSGWQGNPARFRVFTGGEHLPRELLKPLLLRAKEVWNFYGPTEATVLVTRKRMLDASERILVGEPIDNTQLFVVDDQLTEVADEIAGELLICGMPLAHGYWNRKELEAERFIEFHGQRAYRTGDLCKRTTQGQIECLGRLDNQVKIRGHRIELGEIESILSEQTGVRQAIVLADKSVQSNVRLIGYVVLHSGSNVTGPDLLADLHTKLPDYMVPAAIQILDAFPLTPNGKIDHLALPKISIQRTQLVNDFVPPANAIEQTLVNQWAELLGLERIGVTDNFFQLGGNSLLAAKAASSLSQLLGHNFPVATLFDKPTIRQILNKPSTSDTETDCCDISTRQTADINTLERIGPAYAQLVPERESRAQSGFAIVGMAARFPGASNLEQYWHNLLNGVESIRFFQPDELAPSIPLEERTAKNYVAARGIIDRVEEFDSRFFGISPREAELIDPQQRVLMELAFHALEDAGYNRRSTEKRVGVWVGCFSNTYFTRNLLSNPDRLSEVSEFQLATCCEKDFVATRIAHHLDLRGPAINVNTACSTSLVAVIEACKSLQAGDCDLALAGGSTIVFPQQRGHAYQDGNILSADGHCRPFDAAATGTLFSDGAGLVVLKRLTDAQQDGDRIYAVIRGMGLNNDGGKKASFSAPSVRGQAAAIRMALKTAAISADQIQYVEAHGTATPIGDPIEVAALTEVFRESTSETGYCAIGSVKSNIGHCVAAAGVAGLIKAALSLFHEIIPATLHYQAANPALNLDSSPFFACDVSKAWPRKERPRWAGVSSFGVGGTNSHVILCEAPQSLSDPLENTSPSPVEIWPLSAKSHSSLQQLENAYSNLARQLQANQLADVAQSLTMNREHFSHRSFVVVDSTQQAASQLQDKGKRSYGSGVAKGNKPGLTWMFPGQGSQYTGMGKDLYRHSVVFRTWYDQASEILQPLIDVDLRDLFELREDDPSSNEKLQNTRITQPAIFALSYALAKVWLSVGLRPTRLLGHSVGEFVAATLAGVFQFEDALRLIAKRGDLVSKLPRGNMLSVLAEAEYLERILPSGCEIAAINAPKLCVVAGSQSSINNLMVALKSNDIACRLLLTSHAFHSSMMDTAVEPLEKFIAQIDRHAPSIPIYSTVTGLPLTDQQATSSRYWSEHLRNPVQFSRTVLAVLETISANRSETMLEIGPRSTLVTLVKKHKPNDAVRLVSSLSESSTRHEELRSWLSAVGQLWTEGHSINWEEVRPAHQVSQATFRGWLPPYPFDRQRLFIDPKLETASTTNHRLASPSATFINPTLHVTNTNMSNQELTRSSRTNHLVSLVRELFENVSGIEIPEHSIGGKYLELGFDSLMLTQLASVLQRKFEIEITFRQLIEELPSIDLLATFLDKHLAADKFPVPSNTNGIPDSASQVVITTEANCSREQNNSQQSTIQGSSALALSTKLELPASDFQAMATQSFSQVLNPAAEKQAGRPHMAGAPVDRLQPAATEQSLSPANISNGPSPQSIVQQQLQLMQLQLQFLAVTAGSQSEPAQGSPLVDRADATQTINPSSFPVDRLDVVSPSIAVETSARTQTHAETLVNPQADAHVAASIKGPVIGTKPMAAPLIPVVTPAINNSCVSSDEPKVPGETHTEIKKVFGAQARVSLQATELEPEVEQKLSNFIQSYNQRTAKSKAYAQRHRARLADPRTVSGFQIPTKEMTYPIVVERSKGAYLFDIDGHQYIDMVCGYGSNLFGHSPDFMVEALKHQLTTGYEIGPQNVLTGEVAELFCELTGNERVAFCNTGSEAVLGAMRIARTITGRDKVVMFTGDYHGILDEVIVRSNKKRVSFPAAPGIPASAVNNILVLEYGSDQALQCIAEEMDNLAAVIVESVQSRRPDFQPHDFLHKLRQMTLNKSTALIFDEVITGFRSGIRGAQGFFDIEADLATYGKVIGGGMPIGVIAGKASYMDALDGGYWQFGDRSRPEVGMTYFAGTFVRHPLALAAAKQTLLYLKQFGPQAYQHLQALSDRLEAGLNHLIEQTGAPLRIARFCSLLKPEFTQVSPFGDLLFAAARRRGLHVWEHRPWFLTLAHTPQDIDQALAIMRESILETQSLGFLPGLKPNKSQSAKPGKDRSGNPGWFIPDSANPGQYIQVADPTS